MLQSNEYDSLDRQTKHTFGNNSIETKYDEYGQKYMDAVKLGSDTLTYLYSPTNDSKRELKAIMIDNYYENVERDFFGRTKKISQSLIGFALTKQFGYYKNGDHATNRVNTIFYGKNGNTDGKLTYTYDKMGNVISVNENGKQRYIYKYDNLSRLIFEKDLYKGSETCYTYDNQGNILTKETNGTVTNYSYVEGTDRLASFGEEIFAYDNMGNPTTYRNMTATWEKGRQLKSLTDGANTVNYTYDAFGLRTNKTVAGETTNYIYANGKLLRQTGNETIDFIYGQDGIMGIKVLGSSNVANRYLFRKNLFGDVTEIYSNSGELVGKYSYTAFGECTIELDTNGIASLNPFRYRGYYYDTETKLYFLKTRYYDPETGRFITIDDTSYLDPDTINGLNLYAYCGNNPVMRTDPNGNAWWHWLVGIAVIALLAVATVATAGVAGVGIGTAFAAGFAGAAIGTGVSGALVTVAAGAFAGAVISASVGLVSGALFGGISSTMNGGSFWNGALEGASIGFMMGAITGAISGGIRSGITYARTTPLLRSVSANELESIKSMKAFSSNGSMESKWFATNKANVAEWAKYFEQSDYVGIRIPKNVLSNQGVYFNSLLDGIGPAYCIDIDLLNTIIRGLWFF